MTRPAPGRWHLLAFPAVLAAGLAAGPAGASAALGAWAWLGCALRRSARPVYPRQRRSSWRGPLAAWAVSSAGLMALGAAAPLLSAASSLGRFPAWAGAAFWALALGRAAMGLPLFRKAAHGLAAAALGLIIACR